MTFDRRTILVGVGASALFAACSKPASAKSFPYTLSDAQWKKRLTGEEYRILRNAGTERHITLKSYCREA